MITKEKLEIYKRYKGDIDGWARVGTQEEKTMMEDKDWVLIEGLIQDIHLIEKDLASEAYKRSIEEKLKENCDGEETVQELKKMLS